MNKEELLFKLDQIEKIIRDEDVPEVKIFKEQVINALLVEDLYKHEIIKKIVEKYKREIEMIDGVLLNSYSDILPDKKRDALLAYKKACQIFIDIFDFENINKNIDNIKRSVKDLENYA